ncbi:cysteine-rich with EGF-like domain protein 2 [Anopheles maculipalpis]|uniref:cysteine-rich with EGF-like domain protein 2 n=1 Tax=Anopheles maculipalpis TaxID=1496333 RepID=UPI0021590494|nr:cysteine-rich with EGF-like domain protein 2 [Anopheles maculipalpis]
MRQTGSIIFCFLVVALLPYHLSLGDIPKPPSFSSGGTKKDKLKTEKLPPCKACTVLVNSFRDGIKRTERAKHDGGDAAWEEERLGSYKTSELRLVEIQERLCTDVTRGEDQCHQLAEDYESQIEEWWKNHQTTHPDLHRWLCVEQATVCCPDGFYGPNCEPCPTCFGNGKCKGNGTRKGNGKCACDEGYAGDNCDSCTEEYYPAFRDDTKLLCSRCHKACAAGGCTGAGPNACRVCRSGWVMDAGRGGCVDVDECIKEAPCSRQQFCVNNEGSYSCLECDKSCDGCSGDGPDLCDKCAAGYELRDGMCTDTSNEKRNQYATFTRYLTYLGLCIATCIVLQNSTWLAALVGLAVAVYISVSEYWLNTAPQQPAAPSPRILDEILQQH